MQAVSFLPLSPKFGGSADEFAEISGKFAEDLMLKLKIEEDENLANEAVEEKEQDDGDEEEEEEFSFVLTNPDGSPISADDLFDNGQIRPMFPIFNRDLLFADGNDGASSPIRPPLRKVFVEQGDITSSSSASESDEFDGGRDAPYCEWSAKRAVEASPERCKKCNSTGFSRLWRFRDFVHRSSSDGKDAFVFLNPSSAARSSGTVAGAVKVDKTGSREEKNGVVRKVKVAKGDTGKTASSAQEKLYVMNRKKRESDKRRSYLPYRVGFFTNVNGLSRNVHPF